MEIVIIIWTESGGLALLFYIRSRITKVQSGSHQLRELYFQATEASSNGHLSLDFCSCITNNKGVLSLHLL